MYYTYTPTFNILCCILVCIMYRLYHMYCMSIFRMRIIVPCACCRIVCRSSQLPAVAAGGSGWVRARVCCTGRGVHLVLLRTEGAVPLHACRTSPSPCVRTAQVRPAAHRCTRTARACPTGTAREPLASRLYCGSRLWEARRVVRVVYLTYLTYLCAARPTAAPAQPPLAGPWQGLATQPRAAHKDML
jgi:hypothetical protein